MINPILLPLYQSPCIRALEQAAQAAGSPLMAQAGLAAAEFARELARGKDVLVLAGPGNNGGDAFEVAVHLKRWFYRVCVVFADDRGKLPPDAAAALAKWEAAGGTLGETIPAETRFCLVVDGLFGIGLARPLSGPHADLVQAANALGARGAPVLALDCPSGLNADTGRALGSVIKATHTITFIARKPGLLTLDGPDLCGEVRVAELGVDAGSTTPAQGHLVDSGILALLQSRPRNFHKGKAGTLGILGGSTGMVGAALLAGRAALKSGTGKVLLGLLAEQPPGVDYQQPELMLRTPQALLDDDALSALVVGPGLGKRDAASKALKRALALELPLVLDADALNLIAAERPLQMALAKRGHPTLLTPHPAEAARLLHTETADVQADRIAAASLLAKRTGALVLAGLAGSLLAQGYATESALLLAVYLHGAAADALAGSGSGPVGLTASEVADGIRSLLNPGVKTAT
ncbi:MAG: NAD(P)H-hydrate epimerase [Proteobacteria bacterium]|nr:NAD(P)H-hydrate epimerase [Pseudomonadota bacterium]